MNQAIQAGLSRQRLFAVIHMFGRQHIVTEGDLLMVKGAFPLKCGQKMLINKCLMLGSNDITIVGRPVLDKEMFRIEATVVEKTMSDWTVNYRHLPRGQRKYLYEAPPKTTLRINAVKLLRSPEIEQ